MTTNPKELTVSDWLRIRSRIAEQLKTEGSQQLLGTRERIAERLLERGFIDVAAVHDAITTQETPTLAAEETAP